jgi:hypothetical protein
VLKSISSGFDGPNLIDLGKSLNCPSKETMKEKLNIEENFESAERLLTPRWILQATENFETFRNWKDLAELKGRFSGTAILCASGPELLADLEAAPKGKIICSQSQIATLYGAGIRADYCAILDATEGTVEQLEREWDREYTRVICTPTIHPHALDILPPGYLVREVNQGSVFHQQISAYMYPHLQSTIQPLGCSGNMLLEVASYMGFSKVYLAGYDYGLKEGGEIRTVNPEEDERDTHEYGDLSPANREGWLTSKVFTTYKIGLYICILNRRIKVAHINDPGNLEEIPIGKPSFDQKPYKSYLESIGYVFEGNKMTWKGTPDVQ